MTPLKFLVDNQLPGALARLLTAQGFECIHVLDRGLAQAPDLQIWRYVAEHGMVLISEDEDFFHIAGRQDSTVQLVWIRLGNCRKKDLFAAIDRVWAQVLERLDAGDRVIEIR